MEAETGRKFLGIYFECCRIYGRIYQNVAKDAYEGSCPRCRRQLRVAIGEGGTKQRFFRAK